MDRDQPDLGRKITQFKPDLTYFAFNLVAGVSLLVLGLYTAVQTLVTQPELEITSFLLTLLLVGLGLILAWLAYQRLSGLGTSYMLYERGVQRTDAAGRRRMSWDQVKTVQRESRTIAIGREGSRKGGRNRWRSWKLTGADGSILAINDQPQLASMMVGMLLVHHWPAVQERIENGEKVPLSGVIVSKEGLEHKGYLIPWSRIDKAQTADHIMLETISGRINWPEINAHDNDDVLAYQMLRRVIEHYLLRES